MDGGWRQSGEVHKEKRTFVRWYKMTFTPVQTNQRPLKEKLVQRVWEVVRVIICYTTPFFMRRWRRYNTAIFAHFCGGGANINSCASLARNCRIDYPWNVSIGEMSSIGSGAWVYALDKIAIGKNVCIGEDVRLITGSHDVASSHFDLVTKQITINDNVWVATGAIVLPGVTIGEGAVVAAGAVVTKDVAPWTVVGGNPAKFIKKRVLKDV